MKKLAVLLCTMALGLSLMACGKDAGENQNPEPTPTADSSVGGNDANVEDNNDATTDDNVGAATSGMSVADIKQAVVDELGENYWPNTEMPAEFLEGFGLTADMYDEFLGEMPMISTNVDTLIVIKAKDGQVAAVESVLNAYRENLVNDTMQYPMNLGKIQASRIETIGNYVCFVQLGADITKEYGENGNEDAVIRHCQEQNELAIEAISKKLGG